MENHIIKNIIAPLLVSVIMSLATTYFTTKLNTIDIEQNTKAIEKNVKAIDEVKKDYVTRRELDLKIASLERTVNRIDRNTEKVINFMINLKK